MATPQLTAPNLAANDTVGVVVGPFNWVPSQVGHECMFFSVSANADASNIDGAITGAIPEWRLVPHDNNIGQRNVHPVSIHLADINWEKLPFWIRNDGKSAVRAGVEITIPAWLAKLGWKFSVPQIKDGQTALRPNQTLKATIAVSKGKDFDETVFAREREHDIVVTVLHDKFPVGGMTFRISKDVKAVTDLSASSRKRVASATKGSRKPAAAGKKRKASGARPKRSR